jgi:hypothetical protein
MVISVVRVNQLTERYGDKHWAATLLRTIFTHRETYPRITPLNGNSCVGQRDPDTQRNNRGIGLPTGASSRKNLPCPS